MCNSPLDCENKKKKKKRKTLRKEQDQKKYTNFIQVDKLVPSTPRVQQIAT